MSTYGSYLRVKMNSQINPTNVSWVPTMCQTECGPYWVRGSLYPWKGWRMNERQEETFQWVQRRRWGHHTEEMRPDAWPGSQADKWVEGSSGWLDTWTRMNDAHETAGYSTWRVHWGWMDKKGEVSRGPIMKRKETSFIIAVMMFAQHV